MVDRVAAGEIVVGVDGSHGSQVALRWAAREAVLRQADLTVVHVEHLPVEGWAGLGMTMAPLPDDFFLWQEAEGKRVLGEAVTAAQKLVAGSTRSVHGELAQAPAAPTLIDLSKDALMVVVGCRGQGALKRTVLGSVSSALVHRAHCPVAVIHDEPVPASDSDAPVLVGFDGSPASEPAMSMAFDEARWRRVDLVVVHAWSDVDWPDYSGLDWSSVMGATDHALTERLSGWQRRYPEVRVRRVVVPDHPARHLLEESERSQLVVVGSRGRGGLAGLLGSVGAAVAHGARIPVIVARHD